MKPFLYIFLFILLAKLMLCEKLKANSQDIFLQNPINSAV
jgi:hypothetical protein